MTKHNDCAVGEPGWRPTEVHPLAELFPMLADDDLAALAEDIKANGIRYPVVVDWDNGEVLDGYRLRADDD